MQEEMNIGQSMHIDTAMDVYRSELEYKSSKMSIIEEFKYNNDIRQKAAEKEKQRQLLADRNAAEEVYERIVKKIRQGHNGYVCIDNEIVEYRNMDKCCHILAKICNELLKERLPDLNFTYVFRRGGSLYNFYEWTWKLKSYKPIDDTAEELYKYIYKHILNKLEKGGDRPCESYWAPSVNMENYKEVMDIVLYNKEAAEICTRLLNERLPNFTFKYLGDDYVNPLQFTYSGRANIWIWNIKTEQDQIRTQRYTKSILY